MRLTGALAGMMQPDFAGKWLDTPNAVFDRHKPLDLIERGEVDRLWRMVFYVEAGIPP